MKRILPFSFAALLALGAPALADEAPAAAEAKPEAPAAEAAEPAEPEKPEVEVLVDGEPAVLKSEVDEIVQAQLARMGAQFGADAVSEYAGQIRRGAARQLADAARQLADKYLILRDLRAKGVQATDEDRAEFFKQATGGETNVAAIAARFGMPVERVQKDIDDQLLLQVKFRELEKAAPAADSITEEQIKARFEEGLKMRPSLTNAAPEQVRASHILVKVDKPEDDAAALEKITKIRERALAGEDFAALAKENSDCPSKARGGDLGAFGHGQMVPEFDKAAFEQPVGEIGEIVKTQFGYHVVKVTEKIPAHVPTLEDFREDIVESIRAEAVMKAQREYIEGLRDAAKLEFVRETVVSEPIAVPAPPSAEEKPAAEAAE